VVGQAPGPAEAVGLDRAVVPLKVRLTTKFTGRRRTTFEFRIDAARRSGATPCYPLLAMTRHDSYRSQPLEIADLARTIIPMPIRIANSGITTAGVPIVLIASERK